jgi:hypothetical protein
VPLFLVVKSVAINLISGPFPSTPTQGIQPSNLTITPASAFGSQVFLGPESLVVPVASSIAVGDLVSNVILNGPNIALVGTTVSANS